MEGPPHRLLNSIGERFWDRHYGIHTRGYFSERQLDLPPRCVCYEPLPFSLLHQLLRRIPAEFHATGFVDFGCGLGRAVFLAARLGYRPVVGVELSVPLCERAHRNVIGTCVQVVNSDAADFQIPRPVRVFFLFNPFTGPRLESVMRHIEQHAEAVGDCVVIAINNLHHLMALTASAQCLAQGVRGFPWGVYCLRQRLHPIVPLGI